MSNGRETFRKVITTPELIEKINPKNIQLMDRFLKNFATKRSPQSVYSYRSNLNIFFCWCVENCDNKFFVDIKTIDLMDFFDYGVTELKWNSNRFAQVHACLSSFSKWIEKVYDESYPNFRNLLPKIEKMPKQTVREKSVFTKEELDGLMQWLNDHKRVQEMCLLAIMMASGARISEVGRFTTTMINERNAVFEGLFIETTEEMQVKGRGVHGKKMKRFLIKDLFMPYYRKWLPIRRYIMDFHGKNHNYIFIKQNGDPATNTAFRAWIKKWDSVLDKHFYPHAMRHFWTTYLLQAGVEKELVQELQQWSSDTLVSLYNDATMRDREWKGLKKLKATLDEEKQRKKNKRKGIVEEEESVEDVDTIVDDV